MVVKKKLKFVSKLIIFAYVFLSNHSIEHLIAIHLCILQVDGAQNHLYDYIFHQIARPQQWFNCQKHGPYIEMQLPPVAFSKTSTVSPPSLTRLPRIKLSENLKLLPLLLLSLPPDPHIMSLRAPLMERL